MRDIRTEIIKHVGNSIYWSKDSEGRSIYVHHGVLISLVSRELREEAERKIWDEVLMARRIVTGLIEQIQ